MGDVVYMERQLSIENRQTLLELIRCGMDLCDECKGITGICFDEILRIALQQSLQSIVYRGLKKNGVAKNVLYNIEESRLKDTRQYVLQNDSLNRISDALTKDKIPHIPLKGAVIRKLYPEPEMRTCVDIDLLVHEKDLEKAIHTIEKTTDFKFRKRNYHDISMVNSSVHLELHFNIKENIENIDKLLDRVWDYAVSDIGYKFNLTPEFQIFHVIAHMSYHMVHGGLGIRPFLDLWLLRNKTSYNIEQLRQMCSDCKILVFYDKCCELVDSWMLKIPLSDNLKTFEDYVFNGGVYGNKENVEAYKQRYNRGFSYYFHRVFMSRKLLELEFPELKKRSYMLPIYQIKRWMRLFERQKRIDVNNEIKRVNSMNPEIIDSFDRLLTSLGL